MPYIKRCWWAEPTPKIDGKYMAEPCKIMAWKENKQPVYCNGWKPACQGQGEKIIDFRERKENEP